MPYIKEANLEKGKNYLVVYFGTDSYEYLRIKDATKRNELFQYIKAILPNSIPFQENQSKLKAGKSH